MKKVLFVCVENSCRSQMAEGFARLFGKGIFEPYSAGSKPSGKVDPMAVEVMKEAGIDISSQKSKGFNDLSIKEFDMAITLGCSDVCPFVLAKEHVEWKIDDPKGKDIGFFRIARDQIKDRVNRLAESIINKEKGR
jgi:glutathione/glutaredoxin type arsenate reductase